MCIRNMSNIPSSALCCSVAEYCFPICSRLFVDAQPSCACSLSPSAPEQEIMAVINYNLIIDPTVQLPDFDLPRLLWSMLNHFRTGQGPCVAVLH